MIFLLSDETQVIERETFTILDALGQIGGIMGVLMGILSVFML